MSPYSGLGDIAEVLVNYQLARQGLIVFAPNVLHLPYDLLVDAGRGQFCRIQVKSTQTSRVVKGKPTNSYTFNVAQMHKAQYKTTDVDYFALVALDLERVLYIPAKDVIAREKNQMSILRRQFMEDTGTSLHNFAEHIKTCRGRLGAYVDCTHLALLDRPECPLEFDLLP